MILGNESGRSPFPLRARLVSAVVLLLLLSAAVVPMTGCTREVEAPPRTSARAVETVMSAGDWIEATTSAGTIRIYARDDRTREYTWNGATRSVVMYERKTRWYGSLGLYFPGTGDHWPEHKGVRRGVMEEGWQLFAGESEFQSWLESRYHTSIHYVYTDGGLVVGWGIDWERNQLNVEVWQIYFGGAKPSKLSGSHNDKIRRGR